MPVRVPGPTTSSRARVQRSAKSSYERRSAGTVEARQIPASAARSKRPRSNTESSSPVRSASVPIRRRSSSRSPSNSPNTVCVLPTSTASSIKTLREKQRTAAGAGLCPAGGSGTRKALVRASAPPAPSTVESRPRRQGGGPWGNQGFPHDSVVVRGRGLADLFRQRFGGQLGLLALAAKLFDCDVARGVDLRARNHPRGPVLVPHPDVLHLQVVEGIARLRRVVEVELVAEVGRVVRHDAEPEQPEDGRVLPLEAKLELCLEFVEFVQVRHLRPHCRAASSSDTRPRPGTTSVGSSSCKGSSANRRSASRG